MRRNFIVFAILWIVAVCLLLPWGDMNVWNWVRVIIGAIIAAIAGVFNYIDLTELYEGGRNGTNGK